jgi:uncharacterized membrane protein
MSPAHLHLMLNHAPLMGTGIALLLLVAGMYRRSADLSRAALWLGAASALLAYPVLLSGQAAEERVEDNAWFNEQLAHEHEERGETALVVALITGVVAGATLWRSRGGRPLSQRALGITGAGLAVSVSLFAWTALAGGQIRHEEVRGPGIAAEQGATGEDRD